MTRDQIRGLIQLTRWKEYVPFVVPLTIIGALMAARPHGTLLDWRLIAVTLANILAVAYAFMINDIEDAPDDARDPARAARNPITSGRIPANIGYTRLPRHRRRHAAALCLRRSVGAGHRHRHAAALASLFVASRAPESVAGHRYSLAFAHAQRLAAAGGLFHLP